MTILQAAVLGLVQGITEFLPISSTAHLRLVPALLSWPDGGAAFAAVIQLGTLLAAGVHLGALAGLFLTLAAGELSFDLALFHAGEQLGDCALLVPPADEKQIARALLASSPMGRTSPVERIASAAVMTPDLRMYFAW